MKSIRSIALAFFLAGALLLPMLGCRICLDTHDLDYPTYGGAWQRTTQDSGRVGSLFDPAGGKIASLVDRNDPPTPDLMERMKHSGDGSSSPSDDPAVDESAEMMKEIDPTEELMNRELDDITEEKERELKDRQLDEIEIRVKRRTSET